jgi:hypothetical protein
MKCEKFNPKLIDFQKSATNNVWKQFGVNLDTTKRKIDVTKHYMPYEEQDKLRDYMLKNYKKLKYEAYKNRTKNSIEKTMAWEILGYFPTGVKKGRKK